MKKYDGLLIKILLAICILTVSVMIAVLAVGKKQIKEEFTPPPFDINAVKGVPEVSGGKQWQSLDTETFSVSVCTDVFVSEGYAEVIFYNDPENNCFLKLRMLNKENSVISETGIIKPGEYIPRVYINSDSFSDETAVLKIMAYEPDTYYSEGAVSVNVNILYKSAEYENASD